MREKILDTIQEFICTYKSANGIGNLWGKPIVRYANVDNEGFAHLKTIISPDHFHPKDFLPEAKTVLSYFLPFCADVMQSNIEGIFSSAQWAEAYLVTNTMAAQLNEHLVKVLKEAGYDAALVRGAGMTSLEVPFSRWSQRHVAYLCGHGTFGMNNMLISDSGCSGRYFSLVTTLDISPDTVVTEQRCLYKRDKSCGVCIRNCKFGALTVEGFDRFRCLRQCLENEKRYPGADVCGKCVTGLPCSARIPRF